jgi:phospholipid/cholesterol/gamma-HCH transport system ATP-binding protein
MRPMIVLQDVHKSFGPQKVLDGVSLTVNEGETVVLMGSSGSGKSVLMKLVIGLLRADSGRVLVNGADVGKLSASELDEHWRKLGILFQGGALFDSMTVFENVAFPLRERLHERAPEVREHVERALSLVGLEDAAEQLPGELSGGMRKRVAFARAMVLQPRILLYDEPTAGLDPVTTETVVDVILRGQQTLHATALMITNNLAVAFSLADRIAFLHDGRILLEGTAAELRQSEQPEIVNFFHAWLDSHASNEPVYGLH